ncbi:IS3 family transposase [Streptomyces otsuchiensis]|uniref:IS3 family transposase n=1 Tax=Streptomyces otsuchiensis TaxID=2681388 RepID=UPI0010322274
MEEAAEAAGEVAGVERPALRGGEDEPLSVLPCLRAVRDAELTERIVEVHARSRGAYGAPRVHAVLMRQGAGAAVVVLHG